LPRILATPPDVLSPRMGRIIEGLAGDWRRLDERIEGLSGEIEAIARQDAGCERLMSVPGVGPIISSAMVAAIGSGDAFTKGRDFAAWLGLVPLLFCGLGWYKPHVDPGDRLADGLRISSIVLLSLDVRLHVRRGHQAHGVAERLELA